jgi:DNA-binding transcriptional MerR regulator
MAWSTRELAELAGTTLNAVRHYHRVGLLDEPERARNGYKQYEVRHLVRLMHIRRLRDLGVPLDQIREATAHGSTSAAALSAIDAEIGKNIQRLQRARTEIAAILRGSAGTDASAVTGHTAARPTAPRAIDGETTIP